MIKIIFLDIDGCMSDGAIYKGNANEELKRFDVKDGFLLQQCNNLGYISAVITGKTSQIVANRCAELNIKYCFQGVSDKLKIAKEILKKENLSFQNAAAIGDDLNDIKLLKAVKMSFAPKDAEKETKKCADIILSKKGGHGAVRQMLKLIMQKNGDYQSFLAKFL